MKTSVTAVRKLVRKWRKRLEIDHKWTFDVAVYSAPEEVDDVTVRDAQAHVIMDDENFNTVLSVNRWLIEDNKELDAVIAHEMVHVVLSRVQSVVLCALSGAKEQIGRTMIEQATEQIARALVKE